MKDKIIVITNNGNKKSILKYLSTNKLLYNIKFYTFKELKKKLFFDYDNKTLEFVMKKLNVSLKVAKIYLENLYFIKDIKNSKVNFLLDLKGTLEQEKLLIRDNLFKSYLIAKKVIVYGFPNLTLEQELILNELNQKIEYKSSSNKLYTPIVYEAKKINDEVEFVANKISELLDNNIKLENINLIFSEDYTNVIKRYFKMFNIPINLKSNTSLFNTIISAEFLNNYDLMSIEDNINYLNDKYQNINDYLEAINKSAMINDKKIRKEFIIEDLKNAKIKENKYDKAVNIASIEDSFTNDDYVFILGFNLNFYPKLVKDDTFFSDIIKEKLNLDTSYSLNEINYLNLKHKITSIKNLTITYKLTSNNNTFYPSLLIDDLELPVKEVSINPSVSYSKLNTELKYAESLDNLLKYNTCDNNLKLYQNNLNIAYREYNNTFTGINVNSLQESWQEGLTLAYTNLEMYNECAFKYYLSRILKIDVFEESFKTIIGTISHHILEKYLEKDLNINIEINNFIKEKGYTLNEKEYFYLEKLSEELQAVIEELKNQATYSKLDHHLFEQELYIYKDEGDIKITFKGLIDKVMYTKVDNKTYLAVVDYKTGNTLITLDNLKWGLNIQLPIYLYLLKKSDQFKDAEIVGFYIEKILDKIPDITLNKPLK
ncbi:MAG: PD-(D/E)XK nuclease family protein, partial [Ruminococcus sp.]|nr:PD-(D/E)XK nuclease family protein [Ruminococcus sp.]